MKRMGLLRAVITQNIDNLHVAAGSRNVLEIHGNVRKLRCVECSARFPRDLFVLSELPPRCPDCGGIVKGDTVMFGKPIPGNILSLCMEEAGRCDYMIVVRHLRCGLPRREPAPDGEVEGRALHRGQPQAVRAERPLQRVHPRPIGRGASEARLSPEGAAKG